MELELYKHVISGKNFSEAAIEERTFFIKALNLLTEINFYQKCYLFSLNKNDTATSGIKTSAQNAQAIYIIKNLAGVLWEAYQVVQKDFYANHLKEAYLNLFDQKSQESLRLISANDDAHRLIGDIRDNFAFHFDTKRHYIKNLIEQFPLNENIELYFAEEHGNNHYQGANDFVIRALLSLTNEADLNGAVERLMKTVVQRARCFLDFFGAFTMAFIQRNQKNKLDFEPITLQNIPLLEEVSLPVFVVNKNLNQEKNDKF